MANGQGPRPRIDDYLYLHNDETSVTNTFLRALDQWNSGERMRPDEQAKITSRFNTTTSTTSTSTKSSNVFEGVTKLFRGGIATQSSTQLPNITEEYTKITDLLDVVIDKQGGVNSLQQIGKNIIDGLGSSMELYMKQQSALRTQVNEEIGVTGQLAEDLRNELSDANPELLRMGIGFDELVRSSQVLVRDSGKFAFINSETWKQAGTAAKAFVGTLEELVRMLPGFENIGMGARESVEMIEKVGMKSLQLGLSSKNTTKELSQNIGKLNEFGFKNGIEGLGNMIRKATEFRMSMSEVFKIAESVMNPEGAIDLAANLQVLGGAIGDFNDPLKLMYMATNNVEGLQDSLIGAASSLATYNAEQGRFEITGVNLRRAREMAKALGVSYDELAKGAIASAERTSAAAAMMASGLDLKDEQKEFLTNITQMKGGKMMIELNSDRIREALGVDKDTKEIALENLSQKQAETLLFYQKELQDRTPEQIVRDQANSVTNIERDLNFLAALARRSGGKAADKLYEELVKGGPLDPKKAADNFSKFATKEAPEVKNMMTGIADAIVDANNKYIKSKTPKGSAATKSPTTNTNTQQGTVAQPTTTAAPITTNTTTAANTTTTTNTNTAPVNNAQPHLFKIDVRVGDERIQVGNPGSYLYL